MRIGLPQDTLDPQILKTPALEQQHRRVFSDINRRTRSSELTRTGRNKLEEEPRSWRTLSTAVESVLDVA